ncbi:MAG: hypothetical protein ACI4MF_12375 [Candidatus Faecivicinus sp.]
MQSRKPARNRRRRVGFRRILSVMMSILIPPLGIFLVWRTRWSNSARYCLTGLAVICMVLIVALLPSPDARVNGGIELVGREPSAEIYGPELPTATVTGYVAPVSQSVFAQDEDQSVEYVYAMINGTYYHTSECRYAYESAQKLTVYEAYYLGYKRCTECVPPEYVPGTLN